MQKHLQTGDVIGTGHKIFVKGSNEYSQCTSAVSGSTKDWTHVGMKQIQATIKYITCGYYHTMVLTGTDESKLTIVDNDDLYAVGGNGDGQCGIENSKQSVKEFTLVPRGESANVRLKSIACGGYFTILLSEPGEIFGVGQKVFLGIEGPDDVIPKITRHNHDVFDSRIVSIECGGGIGAAITENGTLYTVGSVILNNTFFAELTQLPKDDCKVHSYEYSKHTNKRETGKVFGCGFRGSRQLTEIHFSNERINHIFCGYDSTAFLTSKSLYTCGADLTTVRKVPNVNASSLKLFATHLTANGNIIYENDEVLLKSSENKFKITDAPPLAKGETIVAAVTGYNFRVMVIGSKKKKGLALHAYWKFDDVDFINL